MNETLVGVLAIVVFIAAVASIATFVILSNAIKMLPALINMFQKGMVDIVQDANAKHAATKQYFENVIEENAKQHDKQMTLLQDGFRGHVETSKNSLTFFKESHDSQMKLLQDGFRGHVEASKSLVQFLKDGFDSNVDLANQTVEASAKHCEAVMKIDTENAQKVYDALMVSVEMMNMILKGMGYQPSTPEDSGLKDSDQRNNYNRPPAPRKEDGLIIKENDLS